MHALSSVFMCVWEWGSVSQPRASPLSKLTYSGTKWGMCVFSACVCAPKRGWHGERVILQRGDLILSSCQSACLTSNPVTMTHSCINKHTNTHCTQQAHTSVLWGVKLHFLETSINTQDVRLQQCSLLNLRTHNDMQSVNLSLQRSNCITRGKHSFIHFKMKCKTLKWVL